MIGIGPMSHTLIKASMLLAKEKDFPLMFIASRNQVDADELVEDMYVIGTKNVLLKLLHR